MHIDVKKAKDQLSQLILRVAVGDEITITRRGVPIARMIAVEPEAKPKSSELTRESQECTVKKYDPRRFRCADDARGGSEIQTQETLNRLSYGEIEPFY